MAKIKMFVDDFRQFPKGDYQCCRSVESAIMLLSVFKNDVESISLDYHLDTGCGMQILEYMYENKIFPGHINIHSDNERRFEMVDYIKHNFPPNTLLTMNVIN